MPESTDRDGPVTLAACHIGQGLQEYKKAITISESEQLRVHTRTRLYPPDGIHVP